MTPWPRAHHLGSILSLYVLPGSSSNEICGLYGDRLKIKLTAMAKDGEANEALREYLSRVLGISKQKIYLLQGEGSRQKQVLVELPVPEVLSKVMKKELD